MSLELVKQNYCKMVTKYLTYFPISQIVSLRIDKGYWCLIRCTYRAFDDHDVVCATKNICIDYGK